MQVTHVEADPTHVILGGSNEITEFGISNDPAFFKILSSSLYSNQILAVVREVICNAWDAHIAAGKENIPIDISLTPEGGLRIRDYGLGIPHHMIGPIYTIYGGSTKKYDGAQTGGFGLGCKAPFAYTDTFSVDSYNKGTHTSYVMGFSSGESNGRPTAHTLFSIPTTNTGLEVSLAVRDKDFSQFLRQIKSVVYLGGIKANLNNKLLPTVDYSKAKEGFVFFKNVCATPIEIDNQPKIYVRYGNVVYPLSPANRTVGFNEQLYEEIRTTVSNISINKYNHSPALILLAPPDSLSVTPSRETLSFQENTLTTVNGLLARFNTFVKKHSPNYLFSTLTMELVDEADKFLWKDETPSNLFETNWDFSFNEADSQTFNAQPLFDAVDLTIVRFERTGYETYSRNFPHYIKRIKRFIEMGMCGKNMEKLLTRNMRAKSFPTLAQNVIKGYVKKVLKDVFRNGLSHKSLYWHVLGSQKLYRQPLSSYQLSNTTNNLTLLHVATKAVVISNRTNCSPERLELAGKALPHLGLQQHLYYYVSRVGKELDTAVLAFEKMGYNVINMFDRHKWDLPVVEKPKARVREPVTKNIFSIKSGIPLLSNVMTKYDVTHMTYVTSKGTLLEDDVEKTTQPKWVISLPKNAINNIRRYGHPMVSSFLGEGFNDKDCYLIINAIGDEGGLCGSPKQESYFLENGAVGVYEYMFNAIMELVQTSPLFAQYINIEHSLYKLDKESDAGNLMRNILRVPKLVNALKLPSVPVFPAGSREAKLAPLYNLLYDYRGRWYAPYTSNIRKHFTEDYAQSTYLLLEKAVPQKTWQNQILDSLFQFYGLLSYAEDQAKFDHIFEIILKD